MGKLIVKAVKGKLSGVKAVKGKTVKAVVKTAVKAVMSGETFSFPKEGRNVAISLGLDGNAFWSASGVGAKTALLHALLSLSPKGKRVSPVSGPDSILLRLEGQAGVLVWRVSLKGDVYSRNCPESGRVTGSLSALKKGGVSVSAVASAAVEKEISRTGIDRECTSFYKLAPLPSPYKESKGK